MPSGSEIDSVISIRTVKLIALIMEIIMGLFDIFSGKKKPETAMDAFIQAMYVNPPPPKRAKLSDSVD